MVKHIQAIRQQQLTNCLSLFDHFVGLALEGLTWEKWAKTADGHDFSFFTVIDL